MRPDPEDLSRGGMTGRRSWPRPACHLCGVALYPHCLRPEGFKPATEGIAKSDLLSARQAMPTKTQVRAHMSTSCQQDCALRNGRVLLRSARQGRTVGVRGITAILAPVYERFSRVRCDMGRQRAFELRTASERRPLAVSANRNVKFLRRRQPTRPPWLFRFAVSDRADGGLHVPGPSASFSCAPTACLSSFCGCWGSAQTGTPAERGLLCQYNRKEILSESD